MIKAMHKMGTFVSLANGNQKQKIYPKMFGSN